MTMVVQLWGGRDALIKPAITTFKNRDRKYPMRGVPNTFPGAAYRTRPERWMDSTFMPQWLSEPRVISKLSGNRRRVLFMDNCSDHKKREALKTAADSITTEIRFFPDNTTHLMQPCNSYCLEDQYRVDRLMGEVKTGSNSAEPEQVIALLWKVD